MSRMPPEKREAAEAEYRAALERVPGAKEAEAQSAAPRARLERVGPFEQALFREVMAYASLPLHRTYL